MPPARQPLVLVVEDRDELYELYSECLAVAGFAVEGADDGAEAVRKARELCPDVIVMDLHLPAIDGLEATRRIRADPATHHIPIVAVTAFSVHRCERMAAEAGCDGFLVKPVAPDDLIDTARHFANPTHALERALAEASAEIPQ